MANPTITLHQFETIDGLRAAALRDANRVSHIHGQPVQPLLNEAAHQSRLFDTIIDLVGYHSACEIECLEAYADNLITDCLIGRVTIVDALGEAA